MTVTLKNIKKSYGDRIIFDNFNREIVFDKPVVLMGESGGQNNACTNDSRT